MSRITLTNEKTHMNKSRDVHKCDITHTGRLRVGGGCAEEEEEECVCVCGCVRGGARGEIVGVRVCVCMCVWVGG